MSYEKSIHKAAEMLDTLTDSDVNLLDGIKKIVFPLSIDIDDNDELRRQQNIMIEIAQLIADEVLKKREKDD